jgi:hypothetical protein
MLFLFTRKEKDLQIKKAKALYKIFRLLHSQYFLTAFRYIGNKQHTFLVIKNQFKDLCSRLNLILGILLITRRLFPSHTKMEGVKWKFSTSATTIYQKLPQRTIDPLDPRPKKSVNEGSYLFFEKSKLLLSL